MRFIFTADIHLKMWSDKEFTENGIPKKLIEILNTIDQMCNYAHKNNIEDIVIGGDLNDTKGVAHVSAFVLFKQLVSKHHDLNFYILHGNHDAVSDSEGRESAIQLLEEHGNVRIILEPVLENIFDRDVLFIPHSPNMVDELKRYMEHDPEILISHFGLTEAVLSSGISIRTGIRANNLKKIKLTLLGHYHKPQEIIEEDYSIYYAGSPIAIRRDEAGEEKRFLVVDTETFEVESVNTEGYRRFHEILIDDTVNIEEIKEKIERIKNSGDYLVIKKTIANIPKEIESVINENNVIDLYQKDITLRGITASMNSEEQMKRYLEIMEIPKEEHDAYISTGTKIINLDLEEK